MTGPHAIEPDRLRRFRRAYALHRAREGHGVAGEALLSLPDLATGPLAAQWRIRSRTFGCFVARILRPLASEVAPRPLKLVDLGAGNGWLSYRAAVLGHHAVALDIRVDAVDGLGAAATYGQRLSRLFPRVAASFEAMPLRTGCADLAVFNASLHYASDLSRVLGEAARIVRPGGRVAVLDTPFYHEAAAGEAMVAEKRNGARMVFGDLADDLAGLPFVEYLTRGRLEEASERTRLAWTRHRVRYPLAYELRPLWALLRRRREPSRFDLWEGRV